MSHLPGSSDEFAERTLDLVQRITALGLLAGVAISWPLWLLSRELPALPWLEGIPITRAPWDRVLLAFWAATIIALILTPRRAWPLLGAVAFGAILLLQDIARMQPWAFQYLLMLALILTHRAAVLRSVDRAASAKKTLRAVILLLAALYFYSGLHKISATYVDQAFTELVRPIAAALAIPNPVVRSLGYASIPLEISLGIGLLIPRTRRLVAIAATVMHICILVCLSPLGRNENPVVWPWNLAMIALLWTIALRSPAQVPPAQPTDHAASANRPLVGRCVVGAVLVAACLLPAAGLADRWPAYMSWALYAGREPHIILAMPESTFRATPPDMVRVARTLKSDATPHAVFLSDWISAQTHARPFPELWYQEAIARRVLQRFSSLDGLQVVRISRPDRLTGADSITSVPAAEFASRHP